MEQDPIAALLAFPPVPVRARIDGWTPGRQRRFVLALLASGNASRAAAAVGMTVQSAARLRRRPDAAGFDRACRIAAEAGRRRRCLAAIERARARSRRAAKGSQGAAHFSAPGGVHLSRPVNFPPGEGRPPRRPAPCGGSGAPSGRSPG